MGDPPRPRFLEDDDEAEDTLSLSDLPLHDYDSSDLSTPSSSQVFEFSIATSSPMCPADDIIFSGKLLPYPILPSPSPSPVSLRHTASKPKPLSNTRSLGYHKLHQFLYSPEINSSQPPAVAKPRRYLPMFGIVKLPSEMGLRDIKSRQFRRTPPVLFPPEDRNLRHRKISWGLLGALSCKHHSSVAVTTPFGRMPQA